MFSVNQVRVFLFCVWGGLWVKLFSLGIGRALIIFFKDKVRFNFVFFMVRINFKFSVDRGSLKFVFVDNRKGLISCFQYIERAMVYFVFLLVRFWVS